jgi:hypothetical protein
MKTLNTAPGTLQPVPGATEGENFIPQPLPPNGDLPGDITGTKDRYDEAQATLQPDGTTKRASGSIAATAGRLPVQGTRSQDADPTANDGVTPTVENGVPVVHPGSTLR